ncbi:hypothetical protein EON65_05105 [archaeon]|nr:MAG: hypothetical protein EON65_05105 [archaeon]
MIAAVKRGNVEMISLLVAAGANLHLTDWVSIHT